MTSRATTFTAAPAAVKVPAVVWTFWVTKALTTAFGESTSDWSVHVTAPVLAVVIGFVAFCAALALQLRSRTYSTWRYWFAVSMVGVFGTMAADVLHVGFAVPYAVSAVVFAAALAAVFVLWRRTTGTVSVHDVTAGRREWFYWAAVVSTFALGTAVGDLTAVVFGLGYGLSALVFAAAIAVPALAFRFGTLGPVTAFWTAYVLTRPVGASVADWLGKDRRSGGIGVGSGVTAAMLGLAIVAVVAHLSRTGADAPERPADGEGATAVAGRHHRPPGALT